MKSIKLKLVFLLLLIGFQLSIAQSAYTPGKLAVVVIGNGSSALSSTAAPIFIKEFNLTGGSQSGVLRTTLPSTATTGTISIPRALTQSGSSGTEGFINLSPNKQFLTLTGYNCTAGTATVSTTLSTTFPTNTRVVGKIDATGSVDTKTTLNTFYNGTSIRSAITLDGSAYWTTGNPGTAGISYVPDGNIAVPTNINALNTRGINIFNNQLYVTSQSGTIRLAAVGTGLPTTAGQIVTNLNGFLTSTGDPTSFLFLDLNGVSGPDVVYVASFSASPSGLLKYTSSDNGLTWTARGSLLGNIFGITGNFNSTTGNVDLYITSNTTTLKPNSLYSFSDLNVTSGSPANISSNGVALSTAGTLLATAPANTAFGGVAFTPETVVLTPTIFNLTGATTSCSGVGTTIGLSGSEIGVNYQLLNGTSVISTLPGTGSALNFGLQTSSGVYTIKATNSTSGLFSTMNGSSTIYQLPTATISGPSAICSGSTGNLTITLTGLAPWTYSLNGSTSVTTSSSSLIIPINPIVPTSYNVTSLSNSCGSGNPSNTLLVNINPLPTATITSNSYSCLGSSTNLILNFTGTSPWLYSINGGTPVSSSSNTQTVSVSPTVATTYSITSLSDANCAIKIWSEVSAGNSQSLGIKTDSTLWAWGDNNDGQLGDGTRARRYIPTKIGNSKWTAIAAGDGHSLGIKADGTLWAWGNNSYGQLGDGTTIDRLTPVQIGTSTWKSIAASFRYSVAIKSDGTLWAWGTNATGQLGDGTTTGRITPLQVGTSTWIDISLDPNFAEGIKSDSTLWAWGSNLLGALGDGTTTNRLNPVQIGIFKWKKISCGYLHNIGLKSDGTIWTWGYNSGGVLGDGTENTSTVPIQIGSSIWNSIDASTNHTNGIKNDGKLWAWGRNFNGELGDGALVNRLSPVQIGSDSWSKITGGEYFSLGIKSDGTLWSWGSDFFGSLGKGSIADQQSPVQVFSGLSFTTISIFTPPSASITGNTTICSGNTANLTLTFSGTAPWTYSINGGPTATAYSNSETIYVTPSLNTTYSLTSFSDAYCDGKNWNAISSGADHSLAISANGSLWAWGTNTFGQLGNATTTDELNPILISSSTWTSVSAGYMHSLAIKSDGTLWSWGRNTNGEVGDNTITQRNSPVQIGTSTWSSVVAGASISLGIKTDGTLWAWGFNANGQLGDGTTTERRVPVKIGTSTWLSISTRLSFCLAIKSDGTLWAWGYNGSGELGDGTVTQRISPVQIGTSTWLSASAGGQHSLAVKSDGSLWAWGYSNFGQLGDGTNISKSSPVQISNLSWSSVKAGFYHSLALKSDGSLWAWGDNVQGQLGDGTNINRSTPTQIGLSTWSSINVGDFVSFGLKSNGSLWAWGYNFYGQLGDATLTDKNSPIQIWSSAIVKVIASPTVPTITGITNLCSGQSTTLTASSGALPFTWSTGAVTNSISVTPTNTTTYSLSVTGANGCVSTKSVSVNVNPVATINSIANQTICAGNSTTPINFLSNLPSNFSWTNSNSAIGLATNGTSNIGSFISVNNTSSPITSTITVTPIFSGYAYIANTGSNTVSVIDRNTNSVVSTITVGDNPSSVAVNKNGTRVYVANINSNSVSVINALTNTVIATIPVGSIPQAIAISSDGTRVYVANQSSFNVTVINATNNTVLTTVTLPVQPIGLVVNPTGTKVYVASSNFITVLNAQNNTILNTIDIGSTQYGLDISPDGNTLYASNYNLNALTLINTNTNAIITNIPVGNYPYGVSASLDGSKVYVTNFAAQSVSVINTSTNSVIATIPVGSFPVGISCSPEGNRVYVVNEYSFAVAVINTLTNTVISYVPVGNYPASSGKFVTGTTCVGTPTTFTITVNPKPIWYRDFDGDNYGSLTNTVLACSQPLGYLSNNTDCNDANSAINPASNEICGNGIDDNCNLQIDEGCIITFNLNVYIQGFYDNSIHSMVSTVSNAGTSTNPYECDIITVSLYASSNLNTPAFSTSTMLHVDGTTTMQLPSTLGGSSYYVVVKHRNSMETWSKNLVLFTGSTVTFDFTAP